MFALPKSDAILGAINKRINTNSNEASWACDHMIFMKRFISLNNMTSHEIKDISKLTPSQMQELSMQLVIPQNDLICSLSNCPFLLHMCHSNKFYILTILSLAKILLIFFYHTFLFLVRAAAYNPHDRALQDI